MLTLALLAYSGTATLVLILSSHKLVRINYNQLRSWGQWWGSAVNQGFFSAEKNNSIVSERERPIQVLVPLLGVGTAEML